MIDVVDKQRQGLDPALREIVEHATAEPGELVYCGTCSHVVARKTDRIAVNGSHTHDFTNPYGIRFHVGCFAEALGCSISGTPTAADSWFAGFFWRLATCAECHTHLGWYFDQADRYFYGLILDRVQQE
jgi:hypothetical protein